MTAPRPIGPLPGQNALCPVCRRLLYSSGESLVWSSTIKAIKLHVPSTPQTCCLFCWLQLQAASSIAATECATGPPDYLHLRGSSTTLKLEGSDCAVVKRDDVEKPNANSVSWGTVRRWLTECDEHPHSKHELSERRRLMKLKLLLIDVNESCLVSIPSEGEYAALSYKWGDLGENRQPRLMSHNLETLKQPGALDQPEACAQTIRDAMEICRKVGVQYLWVDALCIIQNSEQKSRHMQNMDAIYASAFFTIVPAHSKTAYHGIHGVSLPRRKAHRYEFDHFWFVYGYNSVTNQLAKSPWAGRSWTYQEAALSRRILVFTEELCCLVCPQEIRREDGCLELLRDPGESEPILLLQYEPTFKSANTMLLKTFAQWQEVFPEYQSWVSKSLKDGSLRSSPLKLYSIVLTSYLRRSLASPQDILKAFAGIVAELKPRMGHFRFGLPRIHFLEALTWQYAEHPAASDEDVSSGKRFHPLGRRNGLFPSWSWAGWLHCLGAQICLTSCAFESTRMVPDRRTNPPRMVAVYSRSKKGGLKRVNRTDGSTPELFNSRLLKTEVNMVNCGLILYRTLSEGSVPLETLLIFKTIVLHVNVSKHGFRPEGGWALFPIADEKDELHLRNGGLTVVHLDVEWRKTQGDKLTFAILGIFPSTDFPTMRVIALVVRQDKNGVYYREGLAEMNIDPTVSYEDYVTAISKIGSSEVIFLG